MTKTVLGQLHCGDTVLYVEELTPSPTALETQEQFSVQLGLDAKKVELDLARIRKLKRILAEGERVLLLRHDQATKARNYRLDL